MRSINLSDGFYHKSCVGAIIACTTSKVLNAWTRRIRCETMKLLEQEQICLQTSLNIAKDKFYDKSDGIPAKTNFTKPAKKFSASPSVQQKVWDL